MIHPITGKNISSYKRLMKDPNTAVMWQTVFGKDFSGMAQGNQKMEQKGINSIFVILTIKLPASPNLKLSHMCTSLLIFVCRKQTPTAVE
jgi:hypothetical protein